MRAKLGLSPPGRLSGVAPRWNYHCEERNDEAIQGEGLYNSWIASLRSQ